MQLDYVIRGAQPSDAAQLAVLATQVWLHTYARDGVSATIAEYVRKEITPEHYAALIQSSSARILVAESDSNLLGCAVLQLDQHSATAPDVSVELKTLYVQEHFIGKGIGATLLTGAEKMAESLARSGLWLTVNARNERALSFYSRHRYKKVGTTVFVLGGVGHENHVMAGHRA
jgi:ribosomal protein S18 acetylase RimI-like enzyme